MLSFLIRGLFIDDLDIDGRRPVTFGAGHESCCASWKAKLSEVD